MELLSIKKKVYDLLLKYPQLRDSDNKLIASFWHQQGAQMMTATDFLNRFSKGNYKTPESITRVRRKLQEQHPELRGEKWYKEHAKKQAQNNVKQQLKQF